MGRPRKRWIESVNYLEKKERERERFEWGARKKKERGGKREQIE